MARSSSQWWVYVLQSLVPRFGTDGRALPGFFYVGCSTDPRRRLREHNGDVVGGGRFTARHRPWRLRGVWGPYADQSEALRAERALKRKRGAARLRWSTADSPWCRGLGTRHEWAEQAPTV